MSTKRTLQVVASEPAEPEAATEVWLEQSGESRAALCARVKGEDDRSIIGTVSPDGGLVLWAGLDRALGFPLDGSGHIQVTTP